MSEDAVGLFNRWFVKPIDILKRLPNGDGGFAAFMIALPLYERYIAAKLKIENKPAEDDNVRSEIAHDLCLDSKQSSIFWSVFRTGFMHQEMPKDGKTHWATSSDFKAIPEFKIINGENYVCIDPWKFADRVISKFTSDPRLITASESFPWAHIFVIRKK